MIDLSSGSFPLFPSRCCFGIPVRLHYLFIVFLALQVVGSILYGGLWPLYWFLLLGPILLVTVLVHELGHSLAARQVGGRVEGILLWPLGGLAFIGHDKGPKADMWVAFAGPLTHIPMTAFWVGLLIAATYIAYGTTAIQLAWPYPLTYKNLGVAVCVGSILLNISLFAFNLLVPAYPLDGGRILVDSLLTCGVAERKTALITCCVAAPIAVGIIVFGCVKFQVITILVGLWILWSTWQLFDCYRKNLLAQHPMFAFTANQNAAAVHMATQPAAAPAQPVNPFAYGGTPGSYQPPVVQGYPAAQQSPAGAGRV
ncbi:hypothetical protein OEZ85_008191 [Tetradesmus obliquus]|uniref:Peptidase M50 domain-containing protein n=1 Tax=Tetradesmus obliquus TaxID=3088 RepID=A0ABY8TK60_TETOB|nr:hypothetical protein OEZ85_008191 [Tetradesmus obliquus]